MEIKKILLISLVLVAIGLSLACVSAGSTLVEHDFGTFTMNIPEGMQFEETSAYNFDGPAAGEDITTFNNDPTKTHPRWECSASNITIDYANFEEDGFTSYSDITYNFPTLVNPTSDGDLYIFTDDFNDGRYGVVKESNGQVVLLVGNDLNQLKDMANSIVFK